MLLNSLAILSILLCGFNLAYCFFLPPRVSQGEPVCPSQETMDSVVEDIQDTVSNILQNTVSSLPECGEGNWYRVVNLSAASDGCPSPWVLQTINDTTPRPVCGQASSPGGGCSSVFFSTGGLSYSMVCGRITGRGDITPDGFTGSLDIDSPYVDGVSITHSVPRTHIWTFAASVLLPTICPCSSLGLQELGFVGSDYFCDYFPVSEPTRAVWDGDGCVEDTSQTCCDFNSPPYFSTTLASPTTDEIEVRICFDESSTNENVFIETMEYAPCNIHVCDEICCCVSSSRLGNVVNIHLIS